MRHVPLCLSLLVAALLAPAAACAATVSVESSGSYAGGVFVNGGFTAVDNRITISAVSSTRLRVVDPAAPLGADGAGCTQVDGNTVECTVSTLAAYVLAGPGDDRVTVVGPIRSYVSGFTGDDTLQGGDGVDELDGGSDDDTLRGGAGADLLYDTYSSGLSGDDDLDGEGDGDLLYGGRGADTLGDSGATGIDAVTYFYASSAVTLRVADGLANDGTAVDPDGSGVGDGADADQVLTGFEKIQGSAFGDTIVGGPAAETINGSAGDDDLDGGPGADTIEGNGGNDVIRSRDGLADAHLACDSPSDPSGTVGTADAALIDAADPGPIGCETVDRLPGAATPTPTPTPTPGPGETPAPIDPIGGGVPTPVVAPTILPQCPTVGSLALRSTSTFPSNARVSVTVPVAGWFVLVRLLSTADGTSLLGPPRALKSTGAGAIDVPVSFYTRPPAAGTSVRVQVVAIAPGCGALSVADDVVMSSAAAAKARIAPRPALASRAHHANFSLPPGAPTPLERTADGHYVFDCSPAAMAGYSQFQKDVINAAEQTGGGFCKPVVKPDPEPRCEQVADLVSLGAVTVRMSGECIKKDPKSGVLESKVAVKVNGLQIIPSGGSVTFDPKTKLLQVKGKHKVQFPLGRDTIKVGAIVLRDTSETTKVQLDDLSFELKTPGGSKLGGFLLDTAASAKLTFKPGGGELDLRLKLPKKFGGLQGGTLTKWNSSGIELTDAVIKLPEAQLGRFTLGKGELRYKRRDGIDTWFGTLTVGLPAPKAAATPELEMTAEFVDGNLTKGRVEVRGINKPFGHPAVFLQRVALDIAINDVTATLGGETEITAGPKILKKSVAFFDGRLQYTFGVEPGIWEGTGKLELLSGQKADGSFRYSTDGKLDFEGRVQLPYVLVNVDGRVKGSVALPSSFKLAGQVELAIVGLPTVQGDLAANENAVTVCGTVKDLSLGLTIPYATSSPQLLQGCGLAPWGKGKASKSARRLATTATTTTLPAGLPKAAFAAVGAGGVPNVVLVGPGGRKLQVGVNSPDGVAFANTGDATAYFLVKEPAAGEWRLEVQDGSPAVTETRVAEGLDEPEVKASVATEGDRRVLKYDVDGPQGQRVQFVESANGVEKAIRAVSGKGKGSVRFTPADGDPGKREVLAYVEQDGVPAGPGRKVASFRVGPAPKPSVVGCVSSFTRETKITTGGEGSGGGCTRLKVTRGNAGEKLRVSWGKATDAESYRLEITAAGRREVRIVGSAARSFTLEDVDRDDAVRVEIAGLNDEGAAGPTVRASLAALTLKPTTRKPPADDGVLGLAEFS